MSNLSNGNDRFNAEAAAWDSNPDVHRASSLALKSILEQFPKLREYRDGKTGVGLDVLEIGCGTGLLSLMVSPYVRSLTAVDSASGMITALNLKLAQQPSITNVFPVCAMLEDPDDARIQVSRTTTPAAPSMRFSLVLSHLVLHHIPSLPAVLATMHGLLKRGTGWVALTDFEDFGPEARTFHPESKMAGVERHGIARAEMERLLADAGFVDVQVREAFKMDKEVERVPGGGKGEGVMMEFPFLICMGRRP
ncbi:hypothetical protein LTR39_003971 [Cryomyces antarcticus]|nr:hypothetical protein LTR39_003971 [Cryomyces antarcticus]